MSELDHDSLGNGSSLGAEIGRVIKAIPILHESGTLGRRHKLVPIGTADGEHGVRVKISIAVTVTAGEVRLVRTGVPTVSGESSIGECNIAQWMALPVLRTYKSCAKKKDDATESSLEVEGQIICPYIAWQRLWDLSHSLWLCGASLRFSTILVDPGWMDGRQWGGSRVLEVELGESRRLERQRRLKNDDDDWIVAINSRRTRVI
ncbi:hypothetical protein DFH06DRAFT_1295937 [Mycena polygramma]|nr:hypothetical protein DFH06DRAFT_1295937 [Mycena polygramma]